MREWVGLVGLLAVSLIAGVHMHGWKVALLALAASAAAAGIPLLVFWPTRARPVDGWPEPTWADHWSNVRWRVYRWWWSVRHPYLRWGPRCTVAPPWRLADAGSCVAWRGHNDPSEDGEVWHADGNGYIWSGTRWAWRGPMVDLAEVYRDDPDRDTWGDHFTEECTHAEERPGWSDDGPTYVCLTCGRVRPHTAPADG